MKHDILNKPLPPEEVKELVEYFAPVIDDALLQKMAEQFHKNVGEEMVERIKDHGAIDGECELIANSWVEIDGQKYALDPRLSTSAQVTYTDTKGEVHKTKPFPRFVTEADAPQLTYTQRKLINNSLSGMTAPRSGHSSMTADCRVPGSDAVLQSKHADYSTRKIQNASLSGMYLPAGFNALNGVFNKGLTPGQLTTLVPSGSEGLFPKTNFTHYLWQKYLKKTDQLPKVGYTSYEEKGPMVTEFEHPPQWRQTGKTGMQTAMFEAISGGWYFAGTWIKPLIHAMGIKPPILPKTLIGLSYSAGTDFRVKLRVEAPIGAYYLKDPRPSVVTAARKAYGFEVAALEHPAKKHYYK